MLSNDRDHAVLNAVLRAEIALLRAESERLRQRAVPSVSDGKVPAAGGQPMPHEKAVQVCGAVPRQAELKVLPRRRPMRAKPVVREVVLQGAIRTAGQTAAASGTGMGDSYHHRCDQQGSHYGQSCPLASTQLDATLYVHTYAEILVPDDLLVHNGPYPPTKSTNTTHRR